jgi:uncharacterized protein involved in type VI secretion and phage assembly
MDRFDGAYAATVEDNDDPKGLCRVRVKVPEVLGDETTGWCLPAMPYAGSGVGLAAVPPRGSVVFVEWPAGDVTRVPLWTGAAWADGTGVPNAGPDRVLLVTPAGNKVELRDADGDEALVLTAKSGAKVTLDANGVTVEFGSQKLVMAKSSISFNNGALEVK